jgi:hypothetical protein
MLGQTSANLFRHAAVREAGGWAESLPHGGDCDLVFQLLLRNGPEGLCYDQRIGSVYRKREGQLTESAPTEGYASIIRMRLNQLQSLQDKTNSGFSSHYLSAYRAAIYDACCTLGVHDRVAADRYFREHLGQQYKPTYLRNGNRTLLHIWLRSGLSFRQYLAVRLWAKAIKRFFT